MCKFSIIIPTYNRAHLILRAINSVVHQTYENWELIVVDDGSTDGTQRVLKDFLKDKRIKYIKKDNTGAAHSRNVGAKKAKGDYFAFLDSDDSWEVNMLEVSHHFIKKEDSDKCFYSAFRFVDSRTNEIGGGIFEHPKNMHEALKTSNPIGALPAVIIPRRIFFEVDGFDVEFKARQDVDLYYRISKIFDFIFIPEVLVKVYYKSEDRITANYSNRLSGFQLYLKNHGKDMNFSQKSFLAKRVLFYAFKNKSYKIALKNFPLSVWSIISARFN